MATLNAMRLRTCPAPTPDIRDRPFSVPSPLFPKWKGGTAKKIDTLTIRWRDPELIAAAVGLLIDCPCFVSFEQFAAGADQ